MSHYLEVHPENPQKRFIKQSVDIIHKGGVIVYPTDSSYALGCHIGDKNAVARLRRIRQIDDKHNLTLVCRDLAEIATYAKIENAEIIVVGPQIYSIDNAGFSVPDSLSFTAGWNA